MKRTSGVLEDIWDVLKQNEKETSIDKIKQIYSNSRIKPSIVSYIKQLAEAGKLSEDFRNEILIAIGEQLPQPGQFVVYDHPAFLNLSKEELKKIKISISR